MRKPYQNPTSESTCHINRQCLGALRLCCYTVLRDGRRVINKIMPTAIKVNEKLNRQRGPGGSAVPSLTTEKRGLQSRLSLLRFTAWPIQLLIGGTAHASVTATAVVNSRPSGALGVPA